MSEYTFKRITVSKQGKALIVTLDTGYKANAFSLDLMNELTELALMVADDLDISAVILAGQPQVFTGGMNLSDVVVTDPLQLDLRTLRQGAKMGAKMCRAWEDIEAITIAAIEGPCVGAGVALSLALDFRVCADNCLLFVPEIERGMNMSWQSVPRSVNLIGPAKTKQMFILGEKLSGQKALAWGWADYLAQPGEALAMAKDISERLAQVPPIAQRMCKQAINTAANALNHAVSFMDADQFVLAQHSQDYKEGIASFLEKRSAKYTGN